MPKKLHLNVKAKAAHKILVKFAHAWEWCSVKALNGDVKNVINCHNLYPKYESIIHFCFWILKFLSPLGTTS